MKAVEKKPMEKVIYTPENIGGSAMSGRGMTKAEAIKIAEWMKESKAAPKAKS